jgi:hypothetical protein
MQYPPEPLRPTFCRTQDGTRFINALLPQHHYCSHKESVCISKTAFPIWIMWPNGDEPLKGDAEFFLTTHPRAVAEDRLRVGIDLHEVSEPGYAEAIEGRHPATCELIVTELWAARATPRPWHLRPVWRLPQWHEFREASRAHKGLGPMHNKPAKKPDARLAVLIVAAADIGFLVACNFLARLL